MVGIVDCLLCWFSCFLVVCGLCCDWVFLVWWWICLWIMVVCDFYKWGWWVSGVGWNCWYSCCNWFYVFRLWLWLIWVCWFWFWFFGVVCVVFDRLFVCDWFVWYWCVGFGMVWMLVLCCLWLYWVGCDWDRWCVGWVLVLGILYWWFVMIFFLLEFVGEVLLDRFGSLFCFVWLLVCCLKVWWLVCMCCGVVRLWLLFFFIWLVLCYIVFVIGILYCCG